MSWTIPQIWQGGDVWILGGGSSVTKEFGIPEGLINSVIDGSAPPSVYSKYMSYVHDKHVIGVNVAYLIGDWIDIVFFGDTNFFLKHKHKLAAFPGLKVTCSPHKGTAGWVKFVARDGKKPRGISNDPAKVSWNKNSGASAINIAAHAGAKRIMLLGFDMSLDEGHNQHWHDLYGRKAVNANQNHKGTHKPKPLPFGRHLKGFPSIAYDAERLGIEIINISPNSKIEVFEKISLQDFIKREEKK